MKMRVSSTVKPNRLKPMPFAISSSLALLSWFSLLSLITQPAQALTTDLYAEVTDVLNLSLANCAASGTDLTITTSPVTNDGFASDCQTLAISTNAPGYNLTIKAAGSNSSYDGGANTNALLYTTSPTRNPLPVIPSTSSSTSPADAPFAPNALTDNTWGFAVTTDLPTTPAKLANFTSTYTNFTDKSNLYASVPTSEITIYSTTTFPGRDDNYSFYYASKINSAQDAGSYATTITYTVVSEPVPVPVPILQPTATWVKSNTDLQGSSATDITVGLDANMIPITNLEQYVDSSGAPIGGTNYNGYWCNYDKQQWCNAVTVKLDKLVEYQTASTGTPIAEDDILGYFTYVPRYEYQVCRPNATDPVTGLNTSAGCPTNINAQYNFNINFQKSHQKTAFNGTTVGGWSTHPAFTFSATELNGIWVGKFETTGNINAPTVKPVDNSITSQVVGNMFTSGYSIGKTGTTGGNAISGISQNSHNLATANSHMLKNSEWGATSYLSYSIYGAGVNNVQITTTPAYGATANSNYYNILNTSTTGNVYGIFGMSGQNWEYVMGNYNNLQGGSSYMTAMPTGSYIDFYLKSPFTDSGYYTNNNQCTWATCGGHALHETKITQSVASNTQSWDGDYSHFVYSSSPWFERGGYSDDGSSAGLFASYTSVGYSNGNIGFRVVLLADL
jgi:hypothetical protein